MKKDRTLEETDRSIAVYDTEKPDNKLILLFSNTTLCARYVFDKEHNSITTMCIQKTVNKTNRFGKKLTFRFMSAAQLETLGENAFLIVDMNYDRPDFKVEKVGWHSNRISLAREANEKFAIRLKEHTRQNAHQAQLN